jgi:hypothetical protein
MFVHTVEVIRFTISGMAGSAKKLAKIAAKPGCLSLRLSVV